MSLRVHPIQYQLFELRPQNGRWARVEAWALDPRPACLPRVPNHPRFPPRPPPRLQQGACFLEVILEGELAFAETVQCQPKHPCSIVRDHLATNSDHDQVPEGGFVEVQTVVSQQSSLRTQDYRSGWRDSVIVVIR